MNILITGGSGFLGSALLAQVALDPAYEKIYLLIRPTARQSAGARLKELVSKIFSPEQHQEVLKRLHAIPGDLTSPHLGLSVRDRWELLERAHIIVHVGASTDFGAPLDESRKHNVEGTRKVLELAEGCARQGVLKRFDYISTAFVSGDKPGRVTEDDLHRGQTFANNYERSKYEAECLVREYMYRLPIAIHRPSIVVGNSKSGYTPHFKVLYWPLRILSKNLLPFVPGNRRATLDVVPVDFVADALAALMKDPGAVGRTHHLTCGLGEEVTLGRVFRDAVRFADIRRRPLIPFWLFEFLYNTSLKRLFRDEVWQTVELARPYTSYLRGTGVRYDSRVTHQRLRELGVKAPTWRNYGANVMRYCIDSRWGKRLSAPEYSYFERAQA
jgi:long-chain acyl-CoA synthetase